MFWNVFEPLVSEGLNDPYLLVQDLLIFESLYDDGLKSIRTFSCKHALVGAGGSSKVLSLSL